MADVPALAGALVTVIAACAAAFVSIYNAITAAADRRERRHARETLTATLDAADHTAATILQKTGEIHTATNGNLSKLQTDLAVAHEKILGLEKQIATLAASDGARRLPAITVTSPASDPITVRTHRRDTDGPEPHD